MNFLKDILNQNPTQGIFSPIQNLEKEQFSGFIIAHLNVEIKAKEKAHFAREVKKKGLEKLDYNLRLTQPDKIEPLITSISVSEIKKRERIAAQTNTPPLRTIVNYWRFDFRNSEIPLEDLVKLFEEAPSVNFAYAEIKTELASTGLGGAVNDPLAGNQGYSNPAPEGIDAVWARSLGLCGSGVNFVDIERGWHLSHEELNHFGLSVFHNINSSIFTEIHHGTSSIGIVAAKSNNNAGIVGIASEVNSVNLSSARSTTSGNPVSNAPDAIMACFAILNIGDVILIEIMNFLGFPVSSSLAAFDAIRLATGNGLIVIEPAGNSNRNLDSRGVRFDRNDPAFQDSLSIMVGAAQSALPHNRGTLSNYGSRVDCYAWGENIWTTGNAVNIAPTNTDYRGNYGGSSGASAIVAGAALVVQGAYKSVTGLTLSPYQMRLLLSHPAINTPQGPLNNHQNIGCMPDLKAIIGKALGLTPNVYIRDHISDNGAEPSFGRLSSSPDIILRNRAVSDPQASFGEGRGNEFSKTLSQPVLARRKNYIYLRFKNRGALPALKVTADIYFSLPATLVAPAKWKYIGTTKPVDVPVGDTLVVSKAVEWGPSKIPATGHYSLIAVINQSEDPAPPIPGQTIAHRFNLDWPAFLSLVRSNNNVAWRSFNVAPIFPGTFTYNFDFIITGSRDQSRFFDFEIERKLPQNTEVWLEIPLELFQKMNFPSLSQKKTKKAKFVKAQLPNLRSWNLSAIPLDGQEFPCKLIIKSTEEGLKLGTHEISIRQVFEQQEVGRITWALVNKKEEE